MFLKFKTGKQKELIEKAISKSGSERKLSHLIGISKGSIYSYKKEQYNLSYSVLKKLAEFLNEPITKYYPSVIEELPSNWGRKIGGINCVAKKKEEGIFDKHLIKLRKASSKYMKNLHKEMKSKSPIEYYRSQYEKFKKIAPGYVLKLSDGTPVRNSLEQSVGNFLLQEQIKFEYEPCIKVGEKVYFPDFKVGNTLIEVTGWKHPNEDKLRNLKNKVKNYKTNRYQIILFIPKNIRKFYKPIDCSLISTLSELKTVLNALVA